MTLADIQRSSEPERAFATLLKWVQLDYGLEREYRFAPPRRWRFDFAWPIAMTAVEIEGGSFVAGRHTRGAGFEKDLEKYNEAELLGWRVLRVTPRMVESGEALTLLKRAWGIR